MHTVVVQHESFKVHCFLSMHVYNKKSIYIYMKLKFIQYI